MNVFSVLLLGAVVAVVAWAFVRRQQRSGVAARNRLSESELVENVKLAVNPQFPVWALFANGTYVIVEGDDIASPREYAIEQIKKFGPVHVGSPAGDFGVTHLNNTDGWSVSGHGYGIYIYVHPSELKRRRPSDVDIGLFGRSKRDADAAELRIIHVSVPD